MVYGSDKKEETHKLRQILEGNSIPTFVINMDHVVTHWNKACEILTGLSADRILGTKNHWKSLYREERSLLADFIVDRAEPEEYERLYGDRLHNSKLIPGALEVEAFIPQLGEDGKWLYFTAAPLINPDGALIGSVESFQDTTGRKMMQAALKQRQEELDEKTKYLERVNQALKATLDHREIEKRAVEENMALNLKRMIVPYLEELKSCRLSSEARAYVSIIDTNLTDLMSPFATSLHLRYSDLTPTEIRVADFIRQGMATKEIAGLLNVSLHSVKWHRKNIREKLGLKNKKQNLQNFLNSLESRHSES